MSLWHPGSRAVALTLLVGLVFWATPCQQLPVVDLTKPAPPDAGSMGVPGAAAGGIVGGDRPVSFPPRYDLNLELRIGRLFPPALGSRVAIEPKPPDFALELIVRNVGRAPFDLPIGRDQAKVQRPGNAERRTLSCRIRPESAENKIIDLPLAGLVFGSKSTPESLLRIEPQQSVLVLLPVDSAAIRGIVAKDATAADIRVVCKESMLSDDRFFVEKVSAQVVSQNAVTVPFKPAGTTSK